MSNKPSLQKTQRGLSMIEVLMALSLLAVAVLAIQGMFPAMALTTKNSMESSRRLQSVQEKLDELMAANVTVVSGSDHPFGLNDGLRQWSGSADPYGSTDIQVVAVTFT